MDQATHKKIRLRANARLSHSIPKQCLICLRIQKWLPEGEFIEAHHIVEPQYGGGEDLMNLMWLCTTCHRLVHKVRREVYGED